jgi:replication-associated recombination protein RarA
MKPLELHEEMRPQTLDDVVGQDKAVAVIRELHAANRIGGRAYFISGKSGTGKTTLANIIAGFIADPYYVLEYVGRRVTPSVLDDMMQTARLYSLGKGGRAFIINEAHGLSQPIIEQFLGWIDNSNVPRHVVIIFTTTRDGQEELFDVKTDAAPLLARCKRLELTCQGLAKAFASRIVAKMAERGREIDMASAVRLVNAHGANFRSIWQALDTGAW